MTPVFKGNKNHSNQAKELEFELKYQRSLTLPQRFKMVIQQSKLVLEMLVKNGYKKPAEVIKRP